MLNQPQLQSQDKIRANEWLSLILSFIWFFLIMFSYQLLRPMREAMAGDLENELSGLFAAVFAVMLTAVFIYAWLASKLARFWLVFTITHFFVINLLLFAAWHHYWPEQKLWLYRFFFVWVTVFNLYITSMFWTVMTDIFSEDRGKKLFGPIASGATLGAIAGSAVAMQAETIGLTRLILASAATLELGSAFAFLLEKTVSKQVIPNDSDRVRQKLQPNLSQGLIEIVNSRYLLMITTYIALISFFGTTFYMLLSEQSKIQIPDRDARISFFAGLNLYTQLGTLFVQFVLVGFTMRKLGLAATLSILPIVGAACFLLCGSVMNLWILGAVDVVSRIATYGFSVPSREVLFTVVNREAKFKSKNFIDTVAIRGADATASAIYSAFKSILSLQQMLWFILPLAGFWIWLSISLGRKQKELGIRN